ncbi:MAG: thioesterase family protein [Myxococcota bacterium]
MTHRVGFHETDAMGIVHHANYLHHFERARVAWLEAHDQPYTAWIAADRHFAVTRVELDYRRPARFDDRIEIATWLEGVGGASLSMGYVIRRGDEILVTGRTEHASVDGQGRVRRLPPADRARLVLRALAVPGGNDASTGAGGEAGPSAGPGTRAGQGMERGTARRDPA